MKLKAICQECGKKILEIDKEYVSSYDIESYEESSECEEHGKNEYSQTEEIVDIFDENNNFSHQEILKGPKVLTKLVIRAFKVVE